MPVACGARCYRSLRQVKVKLAPETTRVSLLLPVEVVDPMVEQSKYYGVITGISSLFVPYVPHRGGFLFKRPRLLSLYWFYATVFQTKKSAVFSIVTVKIVCALSNRMWAKKFGFRKVFPKCENFPTGIRTLRSISLEAFRSCLRWFRKIFVTELKKLYAESTVVL